MTPQEEIERLTAYKNIFDAGNNNSMSAIDQILAKGQHPTTYKVYFDYAPTGLTSNEAASLQQYRLYVTHKHLLIDKRKDTRQLLSLQPL